MLENADAAIETASRTASPVIVKASAGGGGRGIVREARNMMFAYAERFRLQLR